MFHQKIATSLIALLPAVMLQAQVEPPAGSSTPAANAAQRPTKNQSAVEGDAILANWLLVCSNSEVALARIAQEKAQSNEVKLFARKMVDDHGQFASRLQQYAGPTAKGVKEGQGQDASGNKSGRRDGDNGDKRQPAEGEGTRSTGQGRAFDHLALIRELGEKSQEAQAKMLADKSGAEFDVAYMRMQVAAHSQAVIMSEVFANHASSALRPTLEQGQGTLQAHLDQAKALCLQLDKIDKARIGSNNR
jgi:predicted outer membrane protein